MEQEQDVEIDLFALLLELKSKLWLLLGVGFMCACLMFAYTVFLQKPSFSSTTKLYILNRQGGDSITSSDLQSSTYLTKDYTELIRSRTVIESVIARMGLDTTYEKLISHISVSTESDTRVVAISVSSEDPYLACDIANEICDVVTIQIRNVMSVAAVNVVDRANVPTKPTRPNVKVNVMIGFLVGFVLVMLIVGVRFVINDKVTTEDDVEKYLGISVLAVFPVDASFAKVKRGRKRSKNRRG